MEPRIHQLHQPLPSPSTTKTKAKADTSFRQVLEEAQKLKISNHARERLKERNIHLNEAKWTDISSKMTEAKKKGVTDSLVITSEAALVVSIKNNTVITAMGRDEADSKIFTNINGTIVLED